MPPTTCPLPTLQSLTKVDEEENESRQASSHRVDGTHCMRQKHTHASCMGDMMGTVCVCVLMQINAVLSVHTHSSASTGQSHNRDEKTVETADSPKAGSLSALPAPYACSYMTRSRSRQMRGVGWGERR